MVFRAVTHLYHMVYPGTDCYFRISVVFLSQSSRGRCLAVGGQLMNRNLVAEQSICGFNHTIIRRRSFPKDDGWAVRIIRVPIILFVYIVLHTLLLLSNTIMLMYGWVTTLMMFIYISLTVAISFLIFWSDQIYVETYYVSTGISV